MAANVKIGANSTEFNRQMAEMVRELKKVSSSYNLANTQAKLFGSTTDVLKNKQSELTSKINIQNRMVESQSKHLKNLNNICVTPKRALQQRYTNLGESTLQLKIILLIVPIER